MDFSKMEFPSSDMDWQPVLSRSRRSTDDTAFNSSDIGTKNKHFVFSTFFLCPQFSNTTHSGSCISLPWASSRYLVLKMQKGTKLFYFLYNNFWTILNNFYVGFFFTFSQTLLRFSLFLTNSLITGHPMQIRDRERESLTVYINYFI